MPSHMLQKRITWCACYKKVRIWKKTRCSFENLSQPHNGYSPPVYSNTRQWDRVAVNIFQLAVNKHLVGFSLNLNYMERCRLLHLYPSELRRTTKTRCFLIILLHAIGASIRLFLGVLLHTPLKCEVQYHYPSTKEICRRKLFYC